MTITYEIFQGTAPGAEGTTPVASGITGTSQTITGLTNGTTYYFTVKAVDSVSGSVTIASQEVSATPAVPGASTLNADTSNPALSTFVINTANTITFTATGTLANTPVAVTVTNEVGATIATASVTMTNGTGTYTAPTNKYGYYKVSAQLSDSTTIPALATRQTPGYITYCVVPDPATRHQYSATLSRFGMSSGYSTPILPMIPLLGLRWLQNTPGWSTYEPNNAGQLQAQISGGNWPALNIVDSVTWNGNPWPVYELQLVARASTPTWAGPLAGTAGTSTGFGALNSAGVSGLPTFATALGQVGVHNYPNQSQRPYQVTWEPELPWGYDGSGAQLTQYYQLVYANLHSADPNALVCGPTLFPNNDSAQIASMFSAGFGSYIDGYTIHAYVAYPPETNSLVSNIQACISQANTGANKALTYINTESGWSTGSITELQQAQAQIRESLILLGLGFQTTQPFYNADFWNSAPTETANLYGFYYNLSPTIPFGPNKVGPKPAAPAYAALTYLFDGCTGPSQVANLTGSQYGYRFVGGASGPVSGMNIIAFWDYGGTSTYQLNTALASITQFDWMGNATTVPVTSGFVNLQLSPTPIYVSGVGL